MATWSVISIMKEELDVTLRFAAYYLEIGAEFIHLFLDDPEDPAIPYLIKHPQIKLTVCDQDFWPSIGLKKRPKYTMEVQLRSANKAYASSTSDWCLYVDADELVYSPYESIGELLEKCTNDVVVAASCEPLKIKNAGDACVFQAASSIVNSDAIHKIIGTHLRPRALVGHEAGKSFTRVGLHDAHITIHQPKISSGGSLKFEKDVEIYLLHYLNFGLVNWAKKYAKRVDNGDFVRKHLKERGKGTPVYNYFKHVEAILIDGGPQALAKFAYLAKTLNDDQLQSLMELTNCIEFQFDFSRALLKHFSYQTQAHQNSVNIFDWSYGHQQK